MMRFKQYATSLILTHTRTRCSPITTHCVDVDLMYHDGSMRSHDSIP